ncbi:cyanophycinase [Amphibacillus sp. Q70]|uniref:cyanophycinase n=1 Tax=Amphibacillus sp. Q70 TaxID=3453416 RepID=UPI003F833B2E
MFTFKGFFGAIRSAVNPKQSSSLVLIGGKLGTGEHAQTIYKRMAELAGGKKGKIGVITAASNPYDWDCQKRGESTEGGCNDPNAKNSKTVADTHIELFNQYGINAEWIPIDLANLEVADDKRWAQRIVEGEFSGFFFGGGKQNQYTESFYRENDQGEQVDSAVLEAIRVRFESGEAMIAGSSAGAAVQPSEIMITRGKSDHAIVEGAQEGYQPGSPTLTYIRRGGLGFFDYGIVDSHFSERGREGRSIRLASDTRIDKVFGLDETTALVVTAVNRPRAKMEVIGQNGVQILDLSKAVANKNNKGLWSIKNVQSTYLTEGDQYIPKTDRVIFHSDKINIHNKEKYRGNLSSSKDIFSSRKGVKREFINTALNLVNTYGLNTAYGYPRTKKNQYEVVFGQTEKTQAYFVDENDKRTISYTGLQIGIHLVD